MAAGTSSCAVSWAGGCSDMLSLAELATELAIAGQANQTAKTKRVRSLATAIKYYVEEFTGATIEVLQ